MKFRNNGMLTMVGRKSGAFKDKRAGRGGARNEEQEFLDEYQEEQADEREWDGRKTPKEQH